MKLGRFLFLLLGVLCLVSCKESEKERIARLVKEWEGKEILFPQNPIFTIQGKDTVDFDFKDSEYKIVTYVDSVGCTSCKLHLERWKTFIKDVDSVMNGSVPFVFVFHPKNVKELRHILRGHAFNYPVFFDEKDDFNVLNRFPSEMMFQTFLLDKENKVMALGNPVLNPQIKDLYLTQLGRYSIDSLPNTTVNVMETEYDFGVIAQTDKHTHVFQMVNTGEYPLVVSDVVPSCDCTQVQYDHSIDSGDTLNLEVIYSPDEVGLFYRSVDLYLNVKESPVTLWIKGEVSK